MADELQQVKSQKPLERRPYWQVISLLVGGIFIGTVIGIIAVRFVTGIAAYIVVSVSAPSAVWGLFFLLLDVAGFAAAYQGASMLTVQFISGISLLFKVEAKILALIALAAPALINLLSFGASLLAGQPLLDLEFVLLTILYAAIAGAAVFITVRTRVGRVGV